MIDEKQIALARYRVEQAEETLVAAKYVFRIGCLRIVLIALIMWRFIVREVKKYLLERKIL